MLGICNDVKQGRVLSPILFAVYIHELLIKVRSSGVVCYIGNRTRFFFFFFRSTMVTIFEEFRMNHFANTDEKY